MIFEQTIKRQQAIVIQIAKIQKRRIMTFRNSTKLIEDYFRDKPVGSATRNSAGMAFFWMSRLYKVAGDYEAALATIRRGRHSGRRPAAIRPWGEQRGQSPPAG